MFRDVRDLLAFLWKGDSESGVVAMFFIAEFLDTKDLMDMADYLAAYARNRSIKYGKRSRHKTEQ